MNLTIHTYGHIDAMFHILNGIAMIMNSPLSDLMIKAVAMVSTCYFGFKAAYASSSGGSKQSLAKVGSMVLIINSLLIPKTTMFIEDHVTKQRDKVDNLPYGFAIPVGFMEQFGNILTASFEQAFSTVPGGDMRTTNNYRDYGMVFGARLIQEARNWRIKTPEFVHNMDHFIRRCVVMDAAIGHKYTINDLFETDDIWGLITAAPSQLRRIEMKVGNTNELLTCKEAVDNVLKPAFKSEIVRLAEKYSKTEFGRAGNVAEMFTPRGVTSPNNLFKTNLDTIFGGYLGSKNSAETNLKQYMMMNSLSDYARTYGYARASMTQDTNWQIAGDMASTYLPILLSVIKGLVYASFIFMVPLMLLGGGGAKYMSYIAVVASLQLWPALNAVLNMFIDLYSCAQMHDIAGGAVSFTSYSKLGSYSDKIVAVASGLQMMIPFLAFNIVQGGVGGFIQLAGNITGASSSAAASAAGEITTGNKSFDNYSRGNMQIAMNQGFKTDFNQSYKTGARELQNEDGTIQKVLPNNKEISLSGPGYNESSGSNRIMLNHEESSQANKSYAENLEYRKGLEVRRTNAQRTLASQLHQYAVDVNKHDSAQGGINYSSLGKAEIGVKEALSHARQINKVYDFAHSQSEGFGVSLGADVSFKPGGGSVIPGLGVNVGTAAGGNWSYNNGSANTQSIAETNMDSKTIDTSKDQSALIQAAKNKEFNKTTGVSKDLTSNIGTTLEAIEGIDKDINKSIYEGEQIQKQISHSNSLATSFNVEITPEVREQLINSGLKPFEADRLINNPTNASSDDRKTLNSAIQYVSSNYRQNMTDLAHIQSTISKHEQTLPVRAANEMAVFHEEGEIEVFTHYNAGVTNVENTASADGVNSDDIKENLALTEAVLLSTYKDVYNGAIHATQDASKKNVQYLKNKQNEVDEEASKQMTGKKKPKG